MNPFINELFEVFYQRQILLDNEVNFVHCKKPTTTTQYMLIKVREDGYADFIPFGVVVVPGSKSIEMAIYKASLEDIDLVFKRFCMQGIYPRVWFSLLSMAIEGVAGATSTEKIPDLSAYENNPSLKHQLLRTASDACYRSQKRMMAAAASLNAFFQNLIAPVETMPEKEIASIVQAFPIIALAMDVTTQWAHSFDDIDESCSNAWKIANQTKQRWMEETDVSDILDKSELARPMRALVEVIEILRPSSFLQEIKELQEKIAAQPSSYGFQEDHYTNPVDILKELPESLTEPSRKQTELDLLANWPADSGSSTVH